jgi:Outer membrane protein beta-barrel domain
MLSNEKLTEMRICYDIKRILLVLLFTSLFVHAKAQPKEKDDRNLQFGFKAGAVYSNITGISKVLVSESYYTNYTFKNNSTWGASGSIFLNYKFEESISALYSELSYCRLGNMLHYADINDFKYDVAIKYDYVNFELFYKAYIFHGLHLGVGPRIGFNLTPDGLYYTSNGEAKYGPDIRIQQQMRDVLKGRTNFSLGVGIGYEFPMGLTIDARYYYGISDVMETEVNNFNFIENKNAGRSLQFTVGYALPYDFHFFKGKH